MYIGLRTSRYGLATTKRRGGSNGAGVPRPITMNVTMHHSASTAPLAPTTAPTTCAAPMSAGRTTPDQERTRAGRNTRKKPIKRGVGDRTDENERGGPRILSELVQRAE